MLGWSGDRLAGVIVLATAAGNFWCARCRSPPDQLDSVSLNERQKTPSSSA
jgi:hypothetical protein